MNETLFFLEFENNLSNAVNDYIMEFSKDDFFLEKDEKSESFSKKIKQIFSKVYEKIKELIKKAQVYINAKIQSLKINYKLKELKNLLAAKRAKALKKNIKYFDMKEYRKYYSQFINKYTMELKKGLNRDFKSVDEYEQWRTEMDNKLSEFLFKLNDEDRWRLTIAVNNAVQLSSEEIQNREKNLKMVEEDGSRSIKEIEKMYSMKTQKHSFVNDGIGQMFVYRIQDSFIGQAINKLYGCIKTVVKFCAKHIFLTIAGLLAILVAL